MEGLQETVEPVPGANEGRPSVQQKNVGVSKLNFEKEAPTKNQRNDKLPEKGRRNSAHRRDEKGLKRKPKPNN